MSRATLGASPAAAIAYSTFGFTPSNRNPTTWRGRPGRRVEHVVAHHAVLAGEVVAVVVGRAAEELGDRGRDVDQAAGRGHDPVVAHALPRDHERGPGLHDPERAVLAAVTALVLPVVRAGVQHAQVGRRRMVEELRDVVVRERVRVAVARRIRVGELGGEADEPVGRLVGDRVLPAATGALVAVGPGPDAPELDVPVGARRLVGVGRRCAASPCRRSAPAPGSSSTSSARSRSLIGATLLTTTSCVADVSMSLRDAGRDAAGGGDLPDGAGTVVAVGDDVEVAVRALHRGAQAHARGRAR